ncbi:hypothetical protein ACYOEI_13615 [Singulisphaera rosea]
MAILAGACCPTSIARWAAELAAIPELLRLVDIKGGRITIDAMGPQKAIAAQFVEAQADCVLALKGTRRRCIQRSSSTSMSDSRATWPRRRST